MHALVLLVISKRNLNCLASAWANLTIEHLVHSHPVLFAILAKLFNIIMFAGYVPYGIRLS